MTGNRQKTLRDKHENRDTIDSPGMKKHGIPLNTQQGSFAQINNMRITNQSGQAVGNGLSGLAKVGTNVMMNMQMITQTNGGSDEVSISSGSRKSNSIFKQQFNTESQASSWTYQRNSSTSKVDRLKNLQRKNTHINTGRLNPNFF